MPDAPPPRVRFLVVPDGRDPDDVSVRTFPTLDRAESEVAYWQRLVPGDPHQILRAETSYSWVPVRTLTASTPDGDSGRTAERDRVAFTRGH